MSPIAIISSIMAGIALGLFFYGGLWFTVRRLPTTAPSGPAYSGQFLDPISGRAGSLRLSDTRGTAVRSARDGELHHGTLGGFQVHTGAEAGSQMHITPDEIVLWRWGFVHLNATIVFTWVVMLLLTLVSWLVTPAADRFR